MVGRGYEITKRAFDLAICLPAMIVLSPLLAATALAVKLGSPGPIFYRGLRTGRHGRPFRILKFRTMTTDAERAGTTTALNDVRITKVGRVLRVTKLDELPQLLNVVRGEMSLVGPRPEVEEHTREYTEQEQAILTVRPGITDYSSIRFVNLDEILGADDPHQAFITKYRAEKNRLRLQYVQNRSTVEDLRIIVQTLSVIVSNAARRLQRTRGISHTGS